VLCSRLHCAYVVVDELLDALVREVVMQIEAFP